MAIIKDGNQAFGLAQQAINQRLNSSDDDMPLEAVNFNQTSTRVDLNNGNGEPIGSVTVPQREESLLRQSKFLKSQEFLLLHYMLEIYIQLIVKK